MNNNLLLDTHTLLWLRAGAPIRSEAAFLIARSVLMQRIFLSPMLYWELGLAMQKSRLERRPDLGGWNVDDAIAKAVEGYGIQMAAISNQIAKEAADVPIIYGFGDPGDCFLLATAHVEGLTLVTRDAMIIELAERRPDYLKVIPC